MVGEPHAEPQVSEQIPTGTRSGTCHHKQLGGAEGFQRLSGPICTSESSLWW